MKVRYIRKSSKTQTTARQEARQHPDEKLYIDTISGAIPFNERPAAKQLLFDIVMEQITQVSVSSIDRLGRNAFDIQHTLEHFNKWNINVKVDNLGIESFAQGKPNPIFKMITDVLANVAQMERESLKERQAEGIAVKKAKAIAGVEVWNGRGEGKEKMNDADLLAKYKNVTKELSAGLSLRKIAKLTDTSLGTVQRVKAAFDEMQKRD